MWLQIGPSAESPGTDVNARNFRSRASNCALLTITVVCICVLVVCGVMIVREYSLGKGYSPATCNVTNVTYDTNAIKCMYCDTKGKQKEKQGCIFTYFPCVHVLVSYQKTEGGHHHKGMLHTDSLQAAGPYYMCSYSVCLKEREQNNEAVEKFGKSWLVKRGTSFQCFFNTKQPRKVISEKRHTKTQVIHCMLWPSVIIIICGCFFMRVEMKRRGISFCGDDIYPPEKRGISSSTAGRTKNPTGSGATNKTCNVQPAHNGSSYNQVTCSVEPPETTTPHKHGSRGGGPGAGRPGGSNSMSSLDWYGKKDSGSAAAGAGTLEEPKIGCSRSADTLRGQQPHKQHHPHRQQSVDTEGSPSSAGGTPCRLSSHAAEETSPLVGPADRNSATKYRQDSSGSQNKLTGMETPV